MHKTIGLLLACGLMLVQAHVAAADGLYWENVTSVGDKSRGAKIYAMPKMMKIVQDGGAVIIIRGDQDKFYSLDPAKKTYAVMTLAQLEASAKAMRSQMQSAMEKMQEQMKDMPPEQRAKVEQMMKDMGGADNADKAPAVEVKASGDTKTIGGYPCLQYTATADGKTVLTAWTTKDVKGFAALREDWLSYQKRMLEANRGPGAAIASAYAKIDGFPMETVMGEVKTVVTKVEARETPASEFEVPAGYKQEQLEMPKASGH